MIAESPACARGATPYRRRRPRQQKLLGHSSLSTTGDIYTDWDIDQLAETLSGILEEGES